MVVMVTTGHVGVGEKTRRAAVVWGGGVGRHLSLGQSRGSSFGRGTKSGGFPDKGNANAIMVRDRYPLVISQLSGYQTT